jgi:hypothetical protein
MVQKREAAKLSSCARHSRDVTHSGNISIIQWQTTIFWCCLGTVSIGTNFIRPISFPPDVVMFRRRWVQGVARYLLGMSPERRRGRSGSRAESGLRERLLEGGPL